MTIVRIFIKQKSRLGSNTNYLVNESCGPAIKNEKEASWGNFKVHYITQTWSTTQPVDSIYWANFHFYMKNA